MTHILIHVSNGLLLCSYLVKDILWLRVLAVVAGAVVLLNHLAESDPVMVAVYWNILFLTINVYRIYVLILERRPVKLTDDEQHVYQLAFRTLTPHEFRKLLKLARWESAEPEQRIVERDQPLARMMVIASGRTSVRVGGKSVVELKEGQFVGEMSFLTGHNPTADVFAVEPTRLVSWPKAELTPFLEHNPDLRAALQLVIGTDLVGKLRTA